MSGWHHQEGAKHALHNPFSTLYTLTYVCTCMASVSDHPACVSNLSSACDGRFIVCMLCFERSGLLGLWGCGLVSSPVIPVRCLRAVNNKSSRVDCYKKCVR
eukprot:6023755-Prymnesium_polylepis.1